MALFIQMQVTGHNFTFNCPRDWQDGTTLTRLLRGLIGVDLPILDTHEKTLQQAIDCAFHKIKIPRLIDAEDIAKNPDEKSLMTYVTYFYDFEKVSPKVPAFTPPSTHTPYWSDGLALCSLIEASLPGVLPPNIEALPKLERSLSPDRAHNFGMDWVDGKKLVKVVEDTVFRPLLESEKFVEKEAGSAAEKLEVSVQMVKLGYGLEPGFALDQFLELPDDAGLLNYFRSLRQLEDDRVIKWLQKKLPGRSFPTFVSQWKHEIPLNELMKVLVFPEPVENTVDAAEKFGVPRPLIDESFANPNQFVVSKVIRTLEELETAHLVDWIKEVIPNFELNINNMNSEWLSLEELCTLADACAKGSLGENERGSKKDVFGSISASLAIPELAALEKTDLDGLLLCKSKFRPKVAEIPVVPFDFQLPDASGGDFTSFAIEATGDDTIEISYNPGSIEDPAEEEPAVVEEPVKEPEVIEPPKEEVPEEVGEQPKEEVLEEVPEPPTRKWFFLMLGHKMQRTVMLNRLLKASKRGNCYWIPLKYNIKNKSICLSKKNIILRRLE
eukprot:TRINITY_DN317_c0_g1_i6.p1 TRINITY_DN317_c0_g1~~TRINITY_DN317_c0_g1_i6.p1  ORF type:complete len:555 (+),score=181.26 TRINITY_DN317_c0_g1_i6:1951-3615(+)